MKGKLKFVLTVLLVCTACGAAVSSAAYRPVFFGTELIGAFDENGNWTDSPGELAVDGKIVDWDKLEDDKEVAAKFRAAYDAGKNLPCETPLITKGQKIVYYSPRGKEGEAAVTGASLYDPYFDPEDGYEIGYSAELVIGFDGLGELYTQLYGPDPDEWRPIAYIGTAESVNAVPVPTVREETGEGIVFYCDYGGEKFAVTWTEVDAGGDGHKRRFKPTLSIGNDRWGVVDPSFESETLTTYGEQVIGTYDDCGFFDLDGDGTPELAIYNPGEIILFRLDRKSGPKMLARIHPGNDTRMFDNDEI